MAIGLGSERADELLQSPRFAHLVQGFETATGLKLHAYTLLSAPLTVPVEPAEFCQLLQSGLQCPLFFGPEYHAARRPELRRTCAGLGHVVIPVLDTDGTQVASLVSDAARFGPVDMEAITTLSFDLRVFPDDLAGEAESISLCEPERAMVAAFSLFSALQELAAGEVVGARALSGLTRWLAQAEPSQVPAVLVKAVLEFTGAEFAFVRILDDRGITLAEESNLESQGEWWRVLQGTSHWVEHSGRPVDLADVSQSAWCRHLAGSTPPPAALSGMPLLSGETVFGALVVGGTERGRLGEWSSALGVMTTSAADGLLLARRLIQVGGSMVDASTGVYSLRFLEELLEKEISRAGRHQHELSVVLLRIANHAELVSKLGPEAAEAGLARLAEVLRAKTRKVNSLARINRSDFALVIPEAGEEVAGRIARELMVVASTAPVGLGGTGAGPALQFNLDARTVVNPQQVSAVIREMVPSPN